MLLAPGRDVPTTVPGGGWQVVNGASYASAHVAGLAALMRELGGTQTSVPRDLALVLLPTGNIDTCATLMRVVGPRVCSCAVVRSRSAALHFARVAASVHYCATACAQVGGSVVAESDYRFRGVSLSGEDPTARVSLSYDHPGGWYAGASLVGVELEPRPRRAATTAYVGYAHRNGTGWAWEAGATLNHFFGDARYDYGEVFGGFIAERWTARVYLSPDYFGSGVRTIYAELDSGLALTSGLRAFAHLGVLARLAGNAPAGTGRTRYDTRVGLGLRMADFDIRLAWIGTSRGEPYAAAYERHRRAVALSASYDF